MIFIALGIQKDNLLVFKVSPEEPAVYKLYDLTSDEDYNKLKEELEDAVITNITATEDGELKIPNTDIIGNVKNKLDNKGKILQMLTFTQILSENSVRDNVVQMLNDNLYNLDYNIFTPVDFGCNIPLTLSDNVEDNLYANDAGEVFVSYNLKYNGKLDGDLNTLIFSKAIIQTLIYFIKRTKLEDENSIINTDYFGVVFNDFEDDNIIDNNEKDDMYLKKTYWLAEIILYYIKFNLNRYDNETGEEIRKSFSKLV